MKNIHKIVARPKCRINAQYNERRSRQKHAWYEANIFQLVTVHLVKVDLSYSLMIKYMMF